MSKKSPIAGLLCGALWCALPLAAATNHTVKKQSTRPKQEVAPVAPQPAPVIPQPPPTPEEMPATPPKVTMTGGQLSINAENSTLGDVLSAVKGLTGASVDAPTSASGERVVVHLGPGEPQAVLQQLLSGSKFDYIILGSPTNAASIQRIILTARAGAGNAPGSVANNQPPGRPGFQPPTPQDQSENGVDDEIAQPELPPPPQEEVAPPTAGAQQEMIGPGGQAAANGQQPGQDSNQPKSPEQLLQELQRMQQQQRPQRPNTPQ